MKKEDEIKNWDLVTKWILSISILIIFFSFFSPLIFTSSSFFKNLDFTNTGQIGDTIGGIINPFIALAGVLLTFLAFYMQIKANQIQIKQFKEGLLKEKEIRILTEKKDHYNKLCLLKVDLTSIISDIETKSVSIKEYYEKELKFPFETNVLKRTPSKNYTRILDIDRVSVFNGFSLFFSHRKNWIKEFSNLYNMLDFIPVFFDDIYQKSDYHSKDLFEKKMNVRNTLIDLMDKLSTIINIYLKKYDKKDYLSFPESKLANETILRYYKTINESFNEKQDTIKETDFIKIDDFVLKFFLKESLKLREGGIDYQHLEPITELVSNLRKDIYLIKQRAQEFAITMKTEYEKLIIDKKEKSYITVIREIHSILKTELEKIEIE